MGRIDKTPKNVIQQQRTDKKPGWRERARANWQRITGKLTNAYHKARDFFQTKVTPTFKKVVTKENLEKVGKYAEAFSKSASTVSDATRKVGGVVGGKFGNTLQRTADKTDQINKQARDYVQDKVDKGKQLYDKGKQIYNIGRGAYDQIRRNMRERE